MINLPTIYRTKQPRRRGRAELAKAVNKIDYLIEQEYVDLICAAENAGQQEHKVLMQTLWETGLRIQEALDINRGTIMPDGINVMHGKGNKQRFVPAQPGLLNTLKLLANRPGDTRAFRKIKTRSGVLRMLRRYAQAVNLPKRIHPHLFRHSFAINFLRQTMNPFALQDIGGWSDMETIKIYMRLAKEAPREAMQKMVFPRVNY